MTGTSFSFSPEEQHAFYAQPENQEPQGPPRRRKSSSLLAFSNIGVFRKRHRSVSSRTSGHGRSRAVTRAFCCNRAYC